MTVCVEANFSKTAERNKTPFTGIQILLKLSSNQQKIGSLYEEIFQQKATVPNDQNDQFRFLFLYYNQ